MSHALHPDWPLPSLPPAEQDLPYDDGGPMEGKKHRWQMDLLCGSLEDFWADRRDVFIGGNLALYYSLLQVKQKQVLAPDVMVCLGTERRVRACWAVWEEDGRVPDVVVEILSPSTAEVDRGDKKRLYGTVVRVPEYFLFDPDSGQLEGYRLGAGGLGYQPIGPDGAGRLPSERLGLALGVWEGVWRGVEGPWARWYTAQGQLVPSAEEAWQAAEQARQAAEERARELEAQLRAYEARFGPLKP
ncbi:MAG: Uma2 family endonuclease [Myxococcales bacterium]|nr:Uma2 family endonuclease [Myxococcales bacterium]